MVSVVRAVRPSVVAVNLERITVNSYSSPVTHLVAGSGWIIDANGIIVTNDHVIEGAHSLSVTLDDGRIFPAVQVARDKVDDLAVIKIDATGLPVAKLGRSSQLEVGMPVAVLGNSLGRGISMSGGWVSRLGVSITESTHATLYDLIETDAAVNPGNSGGPLATMAGDIVGITNARLLEDSAEDVGFAISIDWALPIITQLVREGHATRPWLGLALHSVNAGIVERMGLSVDRGALILTVAPGSPAARADLHPGDVIVGIGGTSVTNATSAARAILASAIGKPVAVAYWQGAYHGSVSLTPESNPGS